MNSPCPSHQWHTDSEISMQCVFRLSLVHVTVPRGRNLCISDTTAALSANMLHVTSASWLYGSLNLFKSTSVKMNMKPAALISAWNRFGGFNDWQHGTLPAVSLPSHLGYGTLIKYSTLRTRGTISCILPQHTCFLLVQIWPKSSYMTLIAF